jgi:hypothetical protein
MAQKTLTDDDINTYQRRTGTQSGETGTDVDTDAHHDTHAPATDHDAPHTDTDA